MARETKNAAGRGSKAGICVNNQCKNYKQIVEIAHGDLVCPECGKPLTPAATPKNKNNNTLFIIGAIVVAIILALVAIFLGGNKDDQVVKEPQQEVINEEVPVANDDALESVAVEVLEETIEQEEPVAVEEVSEQPVSGEEATAKEEPEPKAESRPTQTTTSSRNKDLGYAIWKGDLKNGQPNDENGTMTYKESHRIDSRDPQSRVAEPGDYIIGEYADGKLVQGVWYDKNNVVKGSIIIGR